MGSTEAHLSELLKLCLYYRARSTKYSSFKIPFSDLQVAIDAKEQAAAALIHRGWKVLRWKAMSKKGSSMRKRALRATEPMSSPAAAVSTTSMALLRQMRWSVLVMRSGWRGAQSMRLRTRAHLQFLICWGLMVSNCWGQQRCFCCWVLSTKQVQWVSLSVRKQKGLSFSLTNIRYNDSRTTIGTTKAIRSTINPQVST